MNATMHAFISIQIYIWSIFHDIIERERMNTRHSHEALANIGLPVIRDPRHTRTSPQQHIPVIGFYYPQRDVPIDHLCGFGVLGTFMN